MGAAENNTGNSKMMKSKIAFSATAIASAIALSACGGGGGGGGSSSGSTTSSSSTPTPSATVTGTLTTAQYAASSAQLAAFNLLNSYRQQCGFPALQENTVLDTAAQNHAKYMGLNNAVSDTEVSGNSGFTGATYLDRAVAAGFPSSGSGWGVAGNYATTASSFNATQAGQQLVYAWVSGVYHLGAVMHPVTTVGIGEYETQLTSSGTAFTASWGTMSLLNTQTQSLSAVTTFPCQGMTGVPYKGVAESPTAPNVSASGWGTPVYLMRNVTDTIVLQSGTMTDTSGNVITLQLLDSSKDTNKEIQSYQGVAYPGSPLSPNTTYTVSITGTVSGTPFSSNFSFTTGNIAG